MSLFCSFRLSLVLLSHGPVLWSYLIPYEQLFILTYHHNGHLITEQCLGEHYPLFQLVTDTTPTSASTIKQTNAPPTAHAKQSSLTQDRGKKQKKYVHKNYYMGRTYCVFHSIVYYPMYFNITFLIYITGSTTF
jgi:hypothetical protein